MGRRRKPEPRVCLVTGCEREIERWQRLCGGCWKRLPDATRKAIGEAMSNRAAHVVASLSIEGAKWIDANSPAAAAARRCGERD